MSDDAKKPARPCIDMEALKKKVEETRERLEKRREELAAQAKKTEQAQIQAAMGELSGKHGPRPTIHRGVAAAAAA